MTPTSQSTLTSSAVERTLEMLQPEARSLSHVISGHIDVLGEEKHVGPRVGQQLFRSKRVMPLIYERLGRPLGAKYIFGRKLSFAEESSLTLGMLDLSPADRVLDVGCGPGNYTQQIAAAARDGLVVGVDASEAMIAAAVERGDDTNLAYVRGDAGQLPFRDAQFDAVCCVGVIHLLPEPMRALDEMVRVLEPGGRMVIGTTRRKGEASKAFAGVTRFGSSTMTDALNQRGLSEVDRRLTGRGQFVLARKAQQK